MPTSDKKQKVMTLLIMMAMTMLVTVYINMGQNMIKCRVLLSTPCLTKKAQ